MNPVHIIGVPLDLGGDRRGVDMGPSAFRIAGLGEQIAALGYTVVDKGDLPAPIPETQDAARRAARSTSARSRRSASSCTRPRSSRSIEGAMPLVLGGDHSLGAGSVAAAADWARQTREAADRPAVGRRARRHEHAGDVAERQRARHAARGAARPRAGGARADRRLRRRRCCPRTPCSSACAISTSAKRSPSATRACTSSR